MDYFLLRNVTTVDMEFSLKDVINPHFSPKFVTFSFSDLQLCPGASKTLVAREQLSGRLRKLTEVDEKSFVSTLFCATVVGRPTLLGLKEFVHIFFIREFMV